MFKRSGSAFAFGPSNKKSKISDKKYKKNKEEEDEEEVGKKRRGAFQEPEPKFQVYSQVNE